MGGGELALWEARLPALLRREWQFVQAMSRPTAAKAASERLAVVAEAEAADRADVQAAQGGDGDAFGRLVRRHQQELGAYLWRFTRNRGQWEELVHDVFVEAYFSLANYAGRGSWAGWLKRIATRVGYRFWQRRERRARGAAARRGTGRRLDRADRGGPASRRDGASVAGRTGTTGPAGDDADVLGGVLRGRDRPADGMERVGGEGPGASRAAAAEEDLQPAGDRAMNAKPRTFAEWVDLARRDSPPAIDVADRVAASIAPRPWRAASDWPLWLACAVSVAAAIMVMAVAGYQGAFSMDPLADLFQPLVPIIQ